MLNKTLTFSRVDSAKFFKTLNGRVNDYFKVNNLKRTVTAIPVRLLP